MPISTQVSTMFAHHAAESSDRRTPPLHRIGRNAQTLVTSVLCIATLLAAAGAPPTSNAQLTGPVPVGSRPFGGLSGKIVYVHGGHGYTSDNKGNGHWSSQRGEGYELIEDFGNYDQMTLFVDYLFRAGATVVPLRPVGHQTHEIVLDNNDAGVTFTGDWVQGTEHVYYGIAGSVPYRQTSTADTESATARYRPQIPAAGFYPVYAWTSSGGNRAADQLYRIHHTGGATEVTVNHRRVGNGLVYLGTYYFAAGTAGFVEISNRATGPPSVVVADMIRFGNGMGDIDRGGGVSSLSREDEAGLYWVKWHVDRAQGIPESEYRALDVDRQATISLAPRYAAFMNRESDGRLKDRVFVSFHSNAGSGKARGVVGLLNGNNDPSTATPNQLLLATSLGQQVNDDMVAQNGRFEHTWHDRKKNTTLDRQDIDFGEINNHYIHDEFDATIVEAGFHDNKEDAELMRDPNVRDALARATYQGLLAYFRAVDNQDSPATRLPGAVTGVYAQSNEVGSVTVCWLSPAVAAHMPDGATGFRVYVSTNGYGFDGGTDVPGGATAATFQHLDPARTYYFKIAAKNEGGESAASEVVAVTPTGSPRSVLLVNGFDRLDRTQNPRQPLGDGSNTVDRVRPRESNARDYVIQLATAIETAAPGTHVESSSNEAVIAGTVDLLKYGTVIWTLGEESTRDRTFDETEQLLVEKFVAGGGNLFVSGAELGWDLDYANQGRSFLRSTLRARYVADDAKTYDVNGVAGGIFADIPHLSFDDGTHAYDADHPDVLGPETGAAVALSYANSAGAAGLQAAGENGRGNVVVLGFPFETIATPAARAAVIERVLTFFAAK